MFETPIINQYNKIIAVLLILAAIIGPVSYFDAYSPHQVLNTFHISVLQNPARVNQLAHLARALHADQSRVKWQNFAQTPAMSKVVASPDLVKNLLAAVGSTVLIAALLGCITRQLCLVCQLQEHAPRLRSADLPPPEKPPTLLFTL